MEGKREVDRLMDRFEVGWLFDWNEFGRENIRQWIFKILSLAKFNSL